MRSTHVHLKAAAAGLAVAILVLGGCKQGGDKAVEAAKPAAQEMAGPKPAAAMPEVERGYAPVNGLKMYYEIHGTGRPLVLIHGAFMTVEAWGDVLTELAKTRRVIALELQGHGRTADIDRPFSYEQFADDVAALMRRIGIDKADVLGYSLGGGVALQAAIRHPEMIDKLVVISGTYRTDGWYPEVMATIAKMTPDDFTGTPIRDGYNKVAPHPEAFPALVGRIKAAEAKVYAWPPDAIRAIASPALIVLGDSDGVRPEHALEMFRLLGGGVFGDIAGMPKSQLAVLPGTHHFGVMYRSAWLVPMIRDFLEGTPLQSPM
jgi:pimeloyl-ACP methyl ester carboxylesterase